MADETDTKPLASLAEAERKVNPPIIVSDTPARPVDLKPGQTPEGWVAPEPEIPATERLRAFEDQHLGRDVMRIGGRIERGSGSPYQNPKVMPPELRRQHAALEHLIVSEQNLADAHTKLLQAEADHEAALVAAEPRPDAGE